MAAGHGATSHYHHSLLYDDSVSTFTPLGINVGTAPSSFRNRRASFLPDVIEAFTPTNNNNTYTQNGSWKWKPTTTTTTTPKRHDHIHDAFPMAPSAPQIHNLISECSVPRQWISAYKQLLAQQSVFCNSSPHSNLKVDGDIRRWVSSSVGSPFGPDHDAAAQIWTIICDAHNIDLQTIDNTDLLFITKQEFFVLCALLGQAAHGEPVTLEAIEARQSSNQLLSPDFHKLLGSPTDSLSDDPPPLPPAPEAGHFEPENPVGSITIQELPDDEAHTHPHSSPRRSHHFTTSGHVSSSSQSSPTQHQGGLYEEAGIWGGPELHHGHGGLGHAPVHPVRLSTPYRPPPPPVMPPPMHVTMASGPPPPPLGSTSLLPYGNSVLNHPQPSNPIPPVYDGWTPIENPFMRPPSPEQQPTAAAAASQPQQLHQVHSFLPTINPGHFGPDGPQGDPSLPSIDPAYEQVTVHINPVKEGFFLFQHRNYQVMTSRLCSKVVRRYSDFLWLLESLHKKYPFRQLPLLPPKRVAINGNHMTSDEHFLEKRRKGLSRFLNTLVKHPVLSRESAVVRFLTVPSELSVWRKQAENSLQEEFTGIILDPSVAELVPNEQVIESFRLSIKQSVEHYIFLCTIIERLGKRNAGIAFDLNRLSRLIRSQTDVTTKVYHLRPMEVNGLNRGLMSVADQIDGSAKILIDESIDWADGVLEDLKFHRDCLVSLNELFERRRKLDHDNIPALEKRVQANEHKLAAIKSRPSEQAKLGEVDKLEEAILKDKISISAQQNRHLLIRICLRDEIAHFQQSLFDVSRLHQKWATQRLLFGDMQAENWRRLVQLTEQMPSSSD